MFSIRSTTATNGGDRTLATGSASALAVAGAMSVTATPAAASAPAKAVAVVPAGSASSAAASTPADSRSSVSADTCDTMPSATNAGSQSGCRAGPANSVASKRSRAWVWPPARRTAAVFAARSARSAEAARSGASLGAGSSMGSPPPMRTSVPSGSRTTRVEILLCGPSASSAAVPVAIFSEDAGASGTAPPWSSTTAPLEPSSTAAPGAEPRALSASSGITAAEMAAGSKAGGPAGSSTGSTGAAVSGGASAEPTGLAAPAADPK